MKDYYYRPETEYITILNECFDTDKDLLDKYHVCAPADMNTCVRKTYYDLKTAESLKFFVLHCTNDETDDIVGFFGVIKEEKYGVLFTFFIKPKYRDQNTMDFFFDSIEKELGMDYYSAIYLHNTRAQRFLEKNNFTVVNEIGVVREKKDAIIFKNN